MVGVMVQPLGGSNKLKNLTKLVCVIIETMKCYHFIRWPSARDVAVTNRVDEIAGPPDWEGYVQIAAIRPSRDTLEINRGDRLAY